jgi:hypothetical protein
MTNTTENAANVDEDEIDDETYADDQDDEDRPAITPHAPIAPAAAGPARFVRDVGGRQVELYLSIEGTRVRMDSMETCTSPEAAREVEQHLRELLMAKGYKQA